MPIPLDAPFVIYYGRYEIGDGKTIVGYWDGDYDVEVHR